MYKGPLGIGVDVVIQNDEGKLLLHQRADDKTWGLPGGWVDKGETPDQAAVREVKEETGLDIELDHLAHVQVREAGTVHLTYIARGIGGSLQKSSESLEVTYKKFNEISTWHTDHKERINKTLGE